MIGEHILGHRIIGDPAHPQKSQLAAQDLHRLAAQGQPVWIEWLRVQVSVAREK